MGNRGDGRLTMLLTEHWWNFLKGREKFSEIAMFYPCEDVFGYTDLFLGYGVIYSLFRLVNINMFMAYKWTLILVHVMGMLSMYYLLRHKLKCNTTWALFGTVGFCFSNAYAVNLGHTQLNAISCLPVFLILLINAIENFDNRKKRNIYIYATIVWFVLLTYTSWYIACFTGIFIIIYIVIFLLLNLKENKKKLITLLQKIKKIWRDVVGYLVCTCILYIPFIKIYIPVLKNSHGYSYQICVDFLPEFMDIINVTENNLMFGWLIKKMGLASRGYSDEVTSGYSIVLLIVFLVLFTLEGKIHQNSRFTKMVEFEKKDSYGLRRITFISVIVGMLLVIRLSSNGASAWWFIYTFIPVAKSMRAVARFLFWLSFPMSVIVAYTANLYQKKMGRNGTFLSILLLLLLFVSNINVNGVSSDWNANTEISFITNVSKPPKEVESFYIIDTDKKNDPAYIYQLDAFEIATWYNIKTINGYSGQFPADWGNMWNVTFDNYESSVYYWVQKYNLKNVFAYDRATNTWIRFEDRMTILEDAVFCPEDNLFSISEGLADFTQGPFAWTKKNFEVKILNDKIRTKGLSIKMQPQLSNYKLQNINTNPLISIYVDGKLKDTIVASDELVNIKIPMEDHMGDEYTISIKTDCYFNPQQIGMSEDTRDLSIAVYYIGD